MRTLLFWSITILASFPPAFLAAAEKAAPKPVDVAICLDTSGSMDGLIDSAKAKLWTIVNDLAKVEPTPVLRVALYQYGNDGLDSKTGWVRREVDLTADLDEIYRRLNDLRTNGGTELVARVSRDALNQLKWSDDADALRMIFVCGNEPANQDTQVGLKEVAELAKSKKVLVNTIYCGSASAAEAAGWKDFALAAGGKYNCIDQNRAKELAIATPQDKELQEWSAKLNKTYFCYGREGKDKKANQELQDLNAEKSVTGAAPERAVTKGGRLYCNDAWDILDRMKNDKTFDIKKLKDEELDEELRKIKPEEREAFLKKKSEERETIQKKIAELGQLRTAFLAEEMKKLPKSAADKALDDAIRATIREQAASKGLKMADK